MKDYKKWIKRIALQMRAKLQSMEAQSFDVQYEEAVKILENYSHDSNSSCYYNGRKTWGGYDLTIIIPSYNNAKLLPICLDSVVSQVSNYSFQVIVINDGSTDNTSELLKNYEMYPNFKIINQTNKGFSGARNIGLDLADGNYIMFVDSDDKLGNNAIEKLKHRVIETDADVVAGNYILVSFDEKHKYNGSCFTDQKVTPWGYLYGQPWGKVYKHELFAKVRFPEGYWYEDSIFAQIVWPMTNTAYTISDIVYEYRKNPKGISKLGVRSHKSLDSLYITRALIEDKKRFGMKLTCEDKDYFLRMTKLTYSRTRRHGGKIAKCIFMVQCKLFEKFNGIETSNYLEMQLALRNRDFKKYMKEVAKLS